MSSRHRDLCRAQEAEIARWPGVTFRREHGGKHPRIIVAFKGRERFTPYSSTPGDYKGNLPRLTALRATIAFLGAVRTPTKSTQPLETA